MVVIQDISDVREAEERRQLMMREIEHRAKNTLAVIQAAVRLGASGEPMRSLARAVKARVAIRIFLAAASTWQDLRVAH